MHLHLLERSQRVPGDVVNVFEFFADAYNLEEVTPPWLHFRVTNAPVPISSGTEIEYSLRLHRIPVRWVSRIEDWDPPRRFSDRQLRGPYSHWHHIHSLEPDGNHVIMRDRVGYSLPLGPLARSRKKSSNMSGLSPVTPSGEKPPVVSTRSRKSPSS